MSHSKCLQHEIDFVEAVIAGKSRLSSLQKNCIANIAKELATDQYMPTRDELFPERHPMRMGLRSLPKGEVSEVFGKHLGFLKERYQYVFISDLVANELAKMANSRSEAKVVASQSGECFRKIYEFYGSREDSKWWDNSSIREHKLVALYKELSVVHGKEACVSDIKEIALRYAILLRQSVKAGLSDECKQYFDTLYGIERDVKTFSSDIKLYDLDLFSNALAGNVGAGGFVPLSLEGTFKHPGGYMCSVYSNSRQSACDPAYHAAIIAHEGDKYTILVGNKAELAAVRRDEAADREDEIVHIEGVQQKHTSIQENYEGARSSVKQGVVGESVSFVVEKVGDHIMNYLNAMASGHKGMIDYAAGQALNTMIKEGDHSCGSCVVPGCGDRVAGVENLYRLNIPMNKKTLDSVQTFKECFNEPLFASGTTVTEAMVAQVEQKYKW